MTALYMVHSYWRGCIAAVWFLLLLIQLGCLLSAIWEREKSFLMELLPFFAATFLGIVLLRCLNDKMDLNDMVPAEGWMAFLYECPWMIVLLLTVAAAVKTIFSLRKIMLFYHNRLSGSSIKESIDNLPTGLSFSNPKGQIFLANRRMEALCYTITGNVFQDAGKFWETLTAGMAIGGVECISKGAMPSFRLPDESVWTFERKELGQMGGSCVIQLTAMDTTKLHALSEQLKKDNERLFKMHDSLKQYGEQIEELVRSREILETRMRIHDEMGQALLATRAYLGQEQPVWNEQELLKCWNNVIALLKKKAVPKDPRGTWYCLTDAARCAGVKIHLEGELPSDDEQMKLLACAFSEALTNAVRHGGADELSVRIWEEGHECKICFTNNGRKPEEEITMGGGLGALKARFEEAGGSLWTEQDHDFALMAAIPLGRIEKC